MAFFWKYTRSGMYSTSYLSFIIDVLPTFINNLNGNLFWKTSFEELELFLTLLQDIEVLNNPSLGITKQAYAQFVTQLGYTATNSYTLQGSSLYKGYATMGKHNGSPLPWGYIDIKTTPMQIDITGLKVSAFPNAIDGLISYHNDDKLLQYRNHPSFIISGLYWDYMPLHSCIIQLIQEMKKIENHRTNQFVKRALGWV